MRNRGILIFSAKAAILAVMVYLILASGNYAMTHDGAWKQYQNPRTRLLWDRVKENEHIVLLGDSVFTSSYNDTDSNAIWSLIEARLKLPVFNGTLDGAKESDLLLATQLISQQGLGRVIIVNITPSRFLQTDEPEKRGGNFNKELNEKIAHSILDTASLQMFGSMAVLDKDIVRNIRKKATFRRAKHMHNFSWRDDSSLALQRLRKLDSVYRQGNNIKSFALIEKMDALLKNSGNDALFVLTPLNSGLLKWYAEQGQRNYLPVFNAIHDSLVLYLEQHKIRYLDLFDGPDEDCFVDALHTNTCGDLFMADKIAEYLTATNMVR